MPWQISSSPRGAPAGSQPCQYSPTPSTPASRPSTRSTRSDCAGGPAEVQVEVHVRALGPRPPVHDAALHADGGQRVHALREVGEAVAAVGVGDELVDDLALLEGDHARPAGGSATAAHHTGDGRG